MTYLGTCCSGCAGMGDVADPTQIRAIGAPSGVDPALYLRAQLNRYTTAGGASLEQSPIAPDALPLTTTIDAATASRALFVLGRRAGDAAQTFSDPATKALMLTYATAWSNPVGYVTANLPAVIDVVRLYADKKGLPAAKGVPTIIGGVAVTPDKLLVVGGVVAAYYLFVKRRRR